MRTLLNPQTRDDSRRVIGPSLLEAAVEVGAAKWRFVPSAAIGTSVKTVEQRPVSLIVGVHPSW